MLILAKRAHFFYMVSLAKELLLLHCVLSAVAVFSLILCFPGTLSAGYDAITFTNQKTDWAAQSVPAESLLNYIPQHSKFWGPEPNAIVYNPQDKAELCKVFKHIILSPDGM